MRGTAAAAAAAAVLAARAAPVRAASAVRGQEQGRHGRRHAELLPEAASSGRGEARADNVVTAVAR